MLGKKRNILIVIFAALFGTACSNPGQYVDRPNAGSPTNPARIVNPTGNPLGNANTGGDSDTNNFEAAVTIQYYDGLTPRTELQQITIARHKTDDRQIRINAPNLNDSTTICIITGAQYDSDPYNLGSFFIDIGEERCGTITDGEGTFTMLRSDFNVVTIIRQEELDAFTFWATDINAPTNAYPSMAQDIIDELLPYPVL